MYLDTFVLGLLLLLQQHLCMSKRDLICLYATGQTGQGMGKIFEFDNIINVGCFSLRYDIILLQRFFFFN